MFKKDYQVNREQQVITAIKQLISECRLVKGNQLPTILELSRMLSVSKDTISLALEKLSYEGLVVIRPRYGTFVARNYLNATKRLDWKDITNKSFYAPSDSKLSKLFDHVDDDGGNPLLSTVSPSDGIYLDFFKQSNQKILKKLKKSHIPEIELYNGSGLFMLKKELASYMKKYGMDVDPRQIIAFSHIQNALSLVLKLLIGADTTIIHEIPGMVNHRSSYVHSIGGKMWGVELDDDGINENALMQAIQKNPNSVLVTEPLYSFPTGATATLAKKKVIYRICQNANIPIIEVDEFRDYDYEGPPTYYTLGGGEGVIYLGSISRTLPYGFPLS